MTDRTYLTARIDADGSRMTPHGFITVF